MEIYLLMGLAAIAIILLVVLLARKPPHDTAVPEAEQRLRDEIRDVRKETADALAQMGRQLAEARQENQRLLLEQQQANLRAAQEQREKLTEAVTRLQESNERKLDQMRETVDEKLTSTLSKRLDSSFQTVGEQLNRVYRSLGEMRDLSSGVSDLRRVLTNVKARGTWAEVQLGNLLEQTLTNEQFARNVSIKNNGELVEFAIKIPSRDKEGDVVWLPIDSKFPQEDYLRLSEAADQADKEATDAAAAALANTVKKEAQTIASKYISVPKTTDFAILFLPTEGLYAEVLRRPGLAEDLQNRYRVMVCGPTTLTAFLNTLRMGFRTIALDRRAAEVWRVLGAAKAQYEKFGEVLERAQRKIEEAGNTLSDAQKRNGIIRKKLNRVEELDETQADHWLMGGAETVEDEDGDLA